MFQLASLSEGPEVGPVPGLGVPVQALAKRARAARRAVGFIRAHEHKGLAMPTEAISHQAIRSRKARACSRFPSARSFKNSSQARSEDAP